ncbi:MAG TPA: hypothetical protein VIT91_08060 [Chthoniobacterales bacterium]
MSRKKVVVMGFMGTCPIAGVIWQHVHYLVGLQQLGHEVYYIEDSARLPYNPVTFDTNEDLTYAGHVLETLGSRYGFAGRWSLCPRYLPDFEEHTLGLPLKRVRQLYVEADAILNVCGAQEFNEDLLKSERILYVESDPGVEQIKIDKGTQDTIDYLGKHHSLFTFGENIGTPEFPVPLHGVKWLPTRQPVATELWYQPEAPKPEALFCTIANWSTSGKKDIEWRGETYLWSKSLEFLKFSAAPVAAGEDFEIATDIKDGPTREKFLSQRWRLVLPHDLSSDYDSYVRYIQASKGEFTVAKDQYVRLKTGWFSDRTACYLAAGRPAITQETGFTRIYGGNGGLFAFTTLEEIAEAVREINLDYRKHSRLAYELACEVFEARKVVASMLERAGV